MLFLLFSVISLSLLAFYAGLCVLDLIRAFFRLSSCDTLFSRRSSVPESGCPFAGDRTRTDVNRPEFSHGCTLTLVEVRGKTPLTRIPTEVTTESARKQAWSFKSKV